MARRLTRRDFIKQQLVGSTLLVSGAAFPGRLLAAPNDPDVAVVKATGPDGPAAATRAAVEALGGMKAIVKPGDKVVLKPNMSFPHPPERGSNTHPLVIQTVAAMCKEAGASRVLVLDHPLSSVERCLTISGIHDACRMVEDNIVFGVTASNQYADAAIPKAETMKDTEVLKQVLDADKLIAVPTAKSHSSAGVSLTMKGMMGLIYNRGVMHWKHDLDEAIVDLAGLLKPDLSVVDATYVLTTGGPNGPGKVLKEDTVIASRDMVAADAMAVASFEWYGRRFEPRQVKHVKRAAERGLGRMDIGNLNVARLTL